MLVAVVASATTAVAVVASEPTRRSATLVQSSIAGDRLTKKAPITLGQCKNPSMHNVVTINETATLHKIAGFGGAFTQSAAQIFAEASADMKAQLIDLYFGEHGHRYTLGRVPIGSCDFSPRHYTYAEQPDDVTLSKFSLHHDFPTLVPLLRAAKAAVNRDGGERLKLVASPWSAPAWMKKNNNYRCPLDPLCFGCTLRDEYLPTWALYMRRYVDGYSALGLAPWAITVQNEPENCPNNYEGMHWSAAGQRDFIRDHLGPALNGTGTLLLAYDHNKDHLPEWADAILADPAGAAHVAGLAFHWYSGAQFDRIAEVHRKFPDALLLATEAAEGGDHNFSTMPSWQMGEHYSSDIIGDLVAGASGWIDWNLFLEPGRQRDGFHFGPQHYNPFPDFGGNNAMLVVDNAEGRIWPQAFYWHMGHFSRYMRPGAVVLHTDCGTSTMISCVAARNPDGSIVLVTLNTGAVEARYEVCLVGSRPSAVRGFNFTSPAHSIQTVIL